MADTEHAAPDWELSKENYQPLKSGRKPAGLRDAAAESKKATVDEQRKALLEGIEKYEGDDPLEAWLRLIKWTQDTFTAGGHKAELLPLLERCTRELQGAERYRTDVRYLRVWIQYADCLPEPGDVFAFLKEHGIGQTHALFYIAHATYLELRGSYSAADNAYQQGINRLAAPADRLRDKCQEFQHRMARRIQRKATEQTAGADDSGTLERPSLALLGGRRGGRAPVGGLGPQKRKAVATPGRDNAPAGGGLQIFVDDEFAGPTASAPPVLANASGSGAAGGGGTATSWAQLPTFDSGRKENVEKASAWAGQRIKQKPAHSAPAAAPLSIPVDPEFETAEAEEEARRRAADAAPQASLRQRLEAAAGARATGGIALDEALASDPLRLHRAAPAACAAPAAPARREEVLACDTAGLQGADGEEQSFEEVRARRWMEQRAAQRQQEQELAAAAEPCPAAPTQQDSFEAAQLMQEDSLPLVAPRPSSVAELSGEPAAMADHPAPAAAEAAALPNPFDQPAPAAPAAEGHVSQAAQEAMAAMAAAMHDAAGSSDVTISTRGAFDAVNAMFGRRVASGALAPAGGGSGDMEPTATISTRDAFAAINSMFGNSMAPAVLPASDPTVTLSTKEAFAALNAMFASGGAAAPDQSHAPLLCVRQDTGLASGSMLGQAAGAGQENAADEGGLCIREDTVFISGPSAARPARSPSPDSPGLLIREDTVFISRPPLAAAAAPSASFMDIREDTALISINGSASQAQENAAPPPALELVVPALGDDTGDLLAGFDGDDDDETLALAAGGMAGKWGFDPGADETLDFRGAVDYDLTEALPARPAPAAAAPPEAPAPLASTGLTHHMGALDLDLIARLQADDGDSGSPLPEEELLGEVENDENAPVAGAARPAARDVRDAAIASLALQPLGRARALELGVEVEEDEGLEAALAAEPWAVQGVGAAPLQDEFAVCPGEAEAPAAASPGAASPSHVNPFAEGFQQHMLGMLDPPVAQWSAVVAVSPEEEAAAGAAFRAARRGAAGPLRLGGREFQVEKMLGKGAYAYVYAATEKKGPGGAGLALALKVESPPCPWEWYVCRVVAGRVPPSLRPAFLDPSALLLGPGTSVLAMPRGRHGSLQDLLNLHLARGRRPGEGVVLHLAAALLRALRALHAARVLHNDVKPDNVLVTVSGGGAVGVQLIDFGRGVDLELLPAGARLRGDCGTEGFRCVEMREGGEWMWQADAYGAAGVVHCLLFGEYMEVERVVDGATGRAALRTRAPFRRYWAGDLWRGFFAELLNHADPASPPPWEALAVRLEAHLAAGGEAAGAARAAELAALAADLAAAQQ